MSKVSICAYSESGGGKSTLLDSAVDWMSAQKGEEHKIARIATAEHDTTFQEKVSDGRIEVVNLNIYDTPFEVVNWVANGRWPLDRDDPKSKWTDPTPETWEKVGLLGMEGLSTISDLMGGSYVAGGLAARSGRKERIGPAEDTVAFLDGSTPIGGNPRTHYNIVQTYIRGAVANSHKLPVYLIWTAHETKAKDDQTGMSIIGPEVFGQKSTQHVPRWFANILHLSKVGREVRSTNKKDDSFIEWTYKLWLKDHYDPLSPSTPTRAKTSINARYQSEVPPSLDGGGLAIGRFLDLLRKFGQIKG